MRKKLPIFYNALLLTGVNLLLRFIGTSFQVFLSGRIGAAGIGLLQLILSVGAFSLTVGMGGIRTATMYLCAEAVGKRKQSSIIWVLSGCITYSLILSTSVAAILYAFAPQISSSWIGEPAVLPAIRILAIFLPINCLCGVVSGYFTGINRIGTLAAVEVAEQLLSMICTVLLLFYADTTDEFCLCVIIGSCIGACFTLISLILIKKADQPKDSQRISIKRKLWETAAPLAIADTVKSGITTGENLIVPKRLALYPGSTAPLAAFGMVCGMVFPLLMFPAAILYGLAELLIPELARCTAAGSKERIRHLVERSLLLTLIYGAFCSGILFISAEALCERLYDTAEAGGFLRQFALLAPMLYCDTIIDAANKGLGLQKISVRNNIITSGMDVVLLFILLPKYGMRGYYISFIITHFINFALSLHLLIKKTGKLITIPAVLKTLGIAVIGIGGVLSVPSAVISSVIYSILFFVLILLLGIIQKNDILWLKGLLSRGAEH